VILGPYGNRQTSNCDPQFETSDCATSGHPLSLRLAEARPTGTCHHWQWAMSALYVAHGVGSVNCPSYAGSTTRLELLTRAHPAFQRWRATAYTVTVLSDLTKNIRWQAYWYETWDLQDTDERWEGRIARIVSRLHRNTLTRARRTNCLAHNWRQSNWNASRHKEIVTTFAPVRIRPKGMQEQDENTLAPPTT